jgi:outer membrane protein OmpA-like peptidoglycan-associated protein
MRRSAGRGKAERGSRAAFYLVVVLAAAVLSLLGGGDEASAAPPPTADEVPPTNIFFEWDKSDLSPESLAIIHLAAEAIKARGKGAVAVLGYSDASGTNAYNTALSQRRADAVKEALIREGVPPHTIFVRGVGKAHPRVATADGVSEAQNRRVEVRILNNPDQIFGGPNSIFNNPGQMLGGPTIPKAPSITGGDETTKFLKW